MIIPEKLENGYELCTLPFGEGYILYLPNGKKKEFLWYQDLEKYMKKKNIKSEF